MNERLPPHSYFLSQASSFHTLETLEQLFFRELKARRETILTTPPSIANILHTIVPICLYVKRKMGRNAVYKRKKNKIRFFGLYEAFSGVFMASGGQKKFAKYTTGQAKVLVLANIFARRKNWFILRRRHHKLQLKCPTCRNIYRRMTLI